MITGQEERKDASDKYILLPIKTQPDLLESWDISFSLFLSILSAGKCSGIMALMKQEEGKDVQMCKWEHYKYINK